MAWTRGDACPQLVGEDLIPRNEWSSSHRAVHQQVSAAGDGTSPMARPAVPPGPYGHFRAWVLLLRTTCPQIHARQCPLPSIGATSRLRTLDQEVFRHGRRLPLHSRRLWSGTFGSWDSNQRLWVLERQHLGIRTSDYGCWSANILGFEPATMGAGASTCPTRVSYVSERMSFAPWACASTSTNTFY